MSSDWGDFETAVVGAQGAVALKCSDGSYSVEALPGWERYDFVNIRTRLVHGVPQLVSFGMVAVAEDADVGLTRALLAKAPVQQLLKIVAAMEVLQPEGDAGPVIAALADGDSQVTIPDRPRGGSDEFSAAVEAVVLTAKAASTSTVQAVATAMNVSKDRANQYIAEAKGRGFLRQGRSI